MAASGSGGPAPLRSRLEGALAAAHKARDQVAARALRDAISAIDNRTAVSQPPPSNEQSGGEFAGSVPGVGAADVPRRIVDEEEAAGLVSAEISERLAAADEYDRLGRPERAAVLRAEAEALRRVLAEA